VLQVKTGMVRVTGGSYADSLVLNADQAVVLEKGVLHRKDAGSFDMSAWKEGVIRLQEASFNEMALMLHNHYSVTVRAETPAIIQYRYSMTVYDKNTLEDILALICAVHNNQYRRYNNEIVIY
jgi:ferric-dicitrate binding protein FerR (iron transport regulator)